MTLDLRKLDLILRKLGDLKVRRRDSPVSSQLSKNQTLAIAVKKHAKVDIKPFFPV